MFPPSLWHHYRLRISTHPSYNPRRMHIFFSHTVQLRQPELDKLSLAIVILCLLDNVEMSILSRIVSDAGRILPIFIVGAYIMIDEHCFKILCSHKPVESKVLCKE